jgi:hypothetical protein
MNKCEGLETRMSKKGLVGLSVVWVAGIIGRSCLILVFKVGQQQSTHVNDGMKKKKKTCLNMKESLGNSSLALHSATYQGILDDYNEKCGTLTGRVG